MLKIDFSKLVICTVSFGQTVIHLHTFILQNLLVLLIFQYKSLFGSGLSRLGYNIISLFKENYLKNKTMKYFEQYLDPNLFIRIHHSHLISVEFIQHLEQTQKDTYNVILKNKQQLPISKTGLAKLKNIL